MPGCWASYFFCFHVHVHKEIPAPGFVSFEQMCFTLRTLDPTARYKVDMLSLIWGARPTSSAEFAPPVTQASCGDTSPVLPVQSIQPVQTQVPPQVPIQYEVREQAACSRLLQGPPHNIQAGGNVLQFQQLGAARTGRDRLEQLPKQRRCPRTNP